MASADSHQTPSILVVVQGRAACPLWMEHWGEAPLQDWSMVEQEEWEPEPAFRDRLEDVLARHALSAAGPTRVVLVASGECDEVALAERWRLCGELLAHVHGVGGGELVVTRGFGHRGGPQPALEALVQDLAADRAAPGCAVRLLLDEVPPASRVRSTSYPPAPRVGDAIA